MKAPLSLPPNNNGLQSEQRLSIPKAKQAKTATLTEDKWDHTQSNLTVNTHNKATDSRTSPRAWKPDFPNVSLLENRLVGTLFFKMLYF